MFLFSNLFPKVYYTYEPLRQTNQS